MKKEEIENELRDISPLLAKMRGKEVEQTPPDNYFQFLENSLMEQVSLEKTPVLQTTNGSQLTWQQRIFSPLSLGSLATFCLLVFAVFFYIEPASSNASAMTMADLTDTEILNYLSENTDDLELETLNMAAEDLSVFDLFNFVEGEEDKVLEDISLESLSEEI